MNRLDKLNELLQIADLKKREEALIQMILQMIADEQEDEIHEHLVQNIMSLYSDQNLELQKNYEEIKRLSTIDPLTQIYNRLKFTERIRYEMESYKRYKRPLALVMFDIDHFKSVNDTFGHDVGDYVLKTLCCLVEGVTRKSDTFARWGGEEFMILMPDAPKDEVYKRAEEIRSAIEAYEFKTVKQITCSFGVTNFQIGETEETFTKRVDEALYASKHNGRNQVTVF